MTAPTRCRSCRAPIWMLVNEKTSKPGPVDIAPAALGNIVIDLEAGTYAVVGKAETVAGDGRERHVSHFMTCPDRARWKGGNRPT